MKEIKEAAKTGNLTLLYVYDSKHPKTAQFERVVLSNQNEPIALAMKVYRCLKLDISKDKVAAGIYQNKVPRFITFNKKGQRVEDLWVKGYKTSSKPVLKALVRTAKGNGKMPLMTFVKKYRSFLNEIDQIEGKKGTIGTVSAAPSDAASAASAARGAIPPGRRRTCFPSI